MTQGSLGFDGPGLDRSDRLRLRTQLDKIRHALLAYPGRRYTLRELAEIGGGSETSASARVRDLRKLEFGGFDIRSEKRGGQGGTWHYWLEGNHGK